MPRRTVAILGASPERSKFGNKSVRAHLSQGYDVYPVNPKGGQIEGLPVYKSLADVPVAHLDRISVYLPPAVGMAVLEEIASQGLRRVVLQSRQRQPGSDRPRPRTGTGTDPGLLDRRPGRPAGDACVATRTGSGVFFARSWRRFTTHDERKRLPTPR